MKNHKNREWRESNTGFYDRSILNENPCKPDCPNRNGECHAKCQAYAEYTEKRKHVYKERMLENIYINMKKR